MKKVKLNFAVFVVCVSVFCSAAAFGQNGDGRPWTVEDSVANRYFVDLNNPGYWAATGSELSISPDGQHFLLVTQQGDLTCDCNRYEMSIWSTASVRAAIASGVTGAVAPMRVVRMASTSAEIGWAGSPIREIEWKDKDTLQFIGTGEMGNKDGLFRFSVRTGKLERLSDPEHNISTSWGRTVVTRGDTVVYNTFQPGGFEVDKERGLPVGFNTYPIQPARGSGLGSGLAKAISAGGLGYSGTYVMHKGKPARALVPPAQSRILPMFPNLSPDGRWTVVTMPHEVSKPVPAEWKEYEGLDAPISVMDTETIARLKKLILFDTQTGRSKPIFDLPTGFNVFAFWSADGKRVILLNVSLPLTEDIENRRKTQYIIDYEIATGKWTVLEPVRNLKGESVTASVWLTEGKALLMKRVDANGKRIDSRLYELTETGWAAKPVPASTAPPKVPKPALPEGLKVVIKESANDPPMAVATDGKSEVTLVSQDPALTGIRRARYQAVKWNERNGHIEEGGLYLPPDDPGQSKKPYPLVIQINEIDKNRFWPDGAGRTAFAAQALAAKGMAVLQMHFYMPESHFKDLKDRSGRPYKDRSEVPEGISSRIFVERIDAAVAELVRQGFVDPRRVGLVGFSATGYRAYYASTFHQKTIPAAAIAADSSLRTFVQRYLKIGITEDAWVQADIRGAKAAYGGSFWDKEAQPVWLEHDPSFNIDKLETPMLFIYNGNLQPINLLELKSIFRANDKEGDMMFIPDGEHQLHRPRQRQASLQATVDWMSFWLKGEEIDPDKTEARREQYYYWRQLKKQRDERWAKNGNPYDKLSKPDATAAKEDAASKTTTEKPNDR